MTTHVRSLFAEALCRLFDETGLFDRAQWKTFLTVVDSTIDGWLADQEVPSPSQLRSILRVLRESDGVPRTPLDEFDRVAGLHTTEATPLAYRMRAFDGVPCRSIEHYMVQAVVEGFLRSLRPLSPEAQEQILFEAAERCREISGAPQPAAQA
ncbi:hypothetical protein HY478_01420 [Candidatus Uhrbacteria bacterium]|nr:hypothetical protein [Candidatus Uhrbacteria bacterium]